MKSNRKLTAFAGAAAALLIVVIAVPAPERENASIVVPSAASFPARAAAPALWAQASEEQLRAQRERATALEWGPDPFLHELAGSVAATPAAVREPSEPLPFPTPRLNGIALFNGARSALIDRQIVSEGDRLVSGHRVGSITDATVTLYRNEEPLILGLGDRP